jgi:hypothetical protein
MWTYKKEKSIEGGTNREEMLGTHQAALE